MCDPRLALGSQAPRVPSSVRIARKFNNRTRRLFLPVTGLQLKNDFNYGLICRIPL